MPTSLTIARALRCCWALERGPRSIGPALVVLACLAGCDRTPGHRTVSERAPGPEREVLLSLRDSCYAYQGLHGALPFEPNEPARALYELLHHVSQDELVRWTTERGLRVDERARSAVLPGLYYANAPNLRFGEMHAGTVVFRYVAEGVSRRRLVCLGDGSVRYDENPERQ
jgi:hypothetical protein